MSGIKHFMAERLPGGLVARAWGPHPPTPAGGIPSYALTAANADFAGEGKDWWPSEG